jgi:RNA polymerase sigma-70 factor, ECF subfamily
MGGNRTSTYDLIELHKGGDASAFRLLFEKHARRLAVWVHYRLGAGLRATVDVDDILQETFMAAARDLPGFEYRSPGSFFRWLIVLASHVIQDAARHNARKKRDGGRREALKSDSHPSGVEPADSLTPSRILFQQERVKLLMRRLDELPEQYRDIIVLAKVEGLSTGEIAERLGKPREAVALLLCRALRRFRQGGAE